MSAVLEALPTSEKTVAVRWPWLAHLSLLNVQLRAAGLAITPDRWANAADLLYQLIEQNAIPATEAELRDTLAPLFCRNAMEQDQFRVLFHQWWQGAHSGQPMLSEAQPVEEQNPQHGETGLAERSPLLRWAMGGRFLLIAVLLVGACVAAVLWYHYSPQPPVGEIVVPPPKTQTIVADLGPPPQATDIPIQPPQPRQPAETNISPMPLPLSDNQRLLLYSSSALVYTLLIALVALVLLRRQLLRIGLRRSKLDPANPLTNLFFQSHQGDLFDGTSVRSALRRLHQPVAVTTHRLDVARTVDATVRKAGLFSPVHATRAYVPEIMVWVNCLSASDPVLGLTSTLVKRLHDQHLGVTLYRYQGSPDYLVPQLSPKQPAKFSQDWLSQEQVLSRHGGSRLILVGNGEGLVDLWSETPLPWLQRLRTEHDLMILEPTGTESPAGRSLKEAGIVLAPLSSAGIEWVTQRLTRGDPTQPERIHFQLPAMLREAERLRQPVPLSHLEQQQLLVSLQQFLGEAGLQVLIAAAVYPELRWAMVLAADVSLITEKESPPETREPRLLKLAQLPWARDGWMPDWVRQMLLDSIDRKQYESLLEYHHQLLNKVAENGADNIELPIRFRGRSSATLRATVRELIARARRNSAYEDGVFADFMWGGFYNRLRFVLPRRLAGLLPHPRFFRRGVGLWISVILAATAMAGAGNVWMQWGYPWLAQQLAGYDISRPVAVRFYAPDNASDLARAVVRAAGIGVDAQLADPANVELPDEIKKSAAPLIVYRVDWEQPAGWLAKRVEYVLYGQAVELKQVDIGSSLDKALADYPMLLWLPPLKTHGHPFRDTLQQPFDATQWQVQREQLQKARADESTDESKATTVQRGRAFQDTLKDGSKSPVMLALSGGIFTMGSPDDETGRSGDEGPQRTVTIAPFALGETEVTFAAYDHFATVTKRILPDDRGWGRDDRPVIYVRWEDAAAYAQWLSEQTGHQYRLPTEAEWEYAARAGTVTPFSTGKCITADQANFDDRKTASKQYADCPLSDTYLEKTQPVKRYDPNAFGLYDMHGNIREWTQDCWHNGYTGAPADGSAWREAKGGDCLRAVVRGGSWLVYPRNLRSAVRIRIDSDVAFDSLGFRLARTL